MYPDLPTLSDVWKGRQYLQGVRTYPSSLRPGSELGNLWRVQSLLDLRHWVDGAKRGRRGVEGGPYWPGPKSGIGVDLSGSPACSWLPEVAGSAGAHLGARSGSCARPRLFQRLESTGFRRC